MSTRAATTPLTVATITGLLAAAALPLDRVGVGWLVVAVVIGVVFAVARRQRPPAPSDEPLWTRGEVAGRAITCAAALALAAVGTLRAADWLHAHRPLVLLVGGPLLTLTLVAINQFVLLNFPNSGDEYVYLYQAETMAAGRLWNPAPPSPEIFATNYVIQEPGRVFGSFPAGWPSLERRRWRFHASSWASLPRISRSPTRCWS